MHNYMKGDIYIDLDYGTWYDSEDKIITGTSGNNTMIFVQASSNTIYAGAGDDKITLSSGSNNNVVYAESGDDFIGSRFARNSTIYGGSGKDTIRIMTDQTYADGGDDDDVLIAINSAQKLNLNGGAGDDTFWFIESAQATATGGAGKDVYHFDPYYLFGPYHNDVVITDISSEDVIRMGNDVSEADGSELVISKSGDDIILKDSESGYGTFNITMKGAAENLDEVSKVTYRSVGLTATLGEIFPDFFADTNTDSGSGDDDDDDDDEEVVEINSAGTAITILEGYDEDTFDVADYGSKIVTIDGSAVSDDIEIFGNSLANKIIGSKNKDTLHGGKGKDTLNGGKGKDKLYGDAGNDKLFGDAGNDLLNGGSGKDTLYGGAGNDTLTGGSGKDVFVYAKSSGKDIITDYKAGTDKIKISSGSISKVSYSGKNVIFKIGTGTLTVKNGKGKKITITDANGNTTTKKYSGSSSADTLALFAENNFMTADNLDSIVKNDSAVSLGELTANNLDTLTQENNLITYTDK